MADQDDAGRLPDSDRRRQVEQELSDLRAQRGDLAGTLGTADYRGDNADQADTVERASELSWIEDRITELTDLLAHGAGDDRGADATGGRVEVGSQVVLEFADGTRETLLVGDIALDAGQSTVLTPDSPLGRAVLGHRVGERLMYPAPSGPQQVTVVEIKPV